MDISSLYYRLLKTNPIFFAALAFITNLLPSLALNWLLYENPRVVLNLVLSILAVIALTVVGLLTHIFLRDMPFDKDFKLSLNTNFLAVSLLSLVSFIALPIRLKFGTNVENLATFFFGMAIITLSVNILAEHYRRNPWRIFFTILALEVCASLILIYVTTLLTSRLISA